MAAVRILNVEDVRAIREFVHRVLELHGYIVQSCESGNDAVELPALGRQFDGVVCNLRMPHFNGRRLYDWIAEHRPELAARFILTTGNVDQYALEFLHDNGVKCLEVPYKPSDLVAIVEAVIGKSS